MGFDGFFKRVLIMKKLLLLLLINNYSLIIIHAQTRLYLRSGAVPLTTPAAPNSNWTVTTGFENLLLMYYNSTIGNGGKTSPATGGAAPRKILQTQWVTPELMAQTVNGTFTAQFKWRSSSGLTVGQGFDILAVNK